MLFIINIGLLLLFNFVKERKLWISIPIVIILIYLGGNPDPATTVDYQAYETEYNNRYLGFVSRFEWLYQYFANVGVKFNLTYVQFRFILVSCTFIILFIAIRRLTTNDKFFWLLFALFPFFVETVQVRSFTMMSLVLLAISFLKKNNIKGYVLSCMSIYLGTGFHTSGYIFFLILPIHFMLSNRWSISRLKWCFLIFLIVSFIVALSSMAGIMGGLTTLIQSISDNEEIANNVTNIYFNGVSISSILLVLSFLSFFLLVFHITKKSQIILDDNMRVLFSYTCVTLIGMPLVMISSQYDRILREGIVGMLIILSIVFVDKNYLKKYIFPTFAVYFIALFIYMGGYRLSSGFLNMIHYIGL